MARPAPAARAAPSFARQAPAARAAPAFRQAAPSHAPRIAAPSIRSAPAIQRAAPASRAASRIERRQQAVQQRRAPASAANNVPSQRLQQLQSRSRLSRSQQRELRTLQRNDRQNARQNNPASPTAQSAQQDRLQQLQSKGRLNRSERRELRGLQRNERQNARQQQNQPAASAQNQQARALRSRPVTAQQAAQGRFASNLRANAQNANGGRFAGRRAARLASRTAWRLGLLAPYIPWYGPVYWPYAYNDMFYYTFWPDAYDPGYWAYAYDDMFDGMFFPDGAPYDAYAAEGPYAVPDGGGSTTGSAPGRTAAPGRLTQVTRNFCADQAKGVTAWPLDQIADAVRPNEDQKALLENLRKASDDAAARFKEACPDVVPMTPPGRLQAMIQRLQAIDEAVQTVKPALQAFYNSLDDEQKARFNEIGPQLGKQQAASNQPQKEADAVQANCNGDKAGISNLAINRIEQAVRPTDAQGEALDKLDEAMQKSIDALRSACPNTIPQTPVGRLDVMQKRLEAMIDAANTVRPALEQFYAALNDEQKAKFNRLGRDTAQGG
jgi:LTXXQ motif family protein